MRIYPNKGSIHFTNAGNGGYLRQENLTIAILDNDYTESIYDISNGKDIISKDKVFISKHSSFPPLLLSRIENIDISRSINIEKATKVVTDKPVFKTYMEDVWYGEFTSYNPELPVIRAVMRDPSYYTKRFLMSANCGNMPDDVSTYDITSCYPCVVLDIEYDLSACLLNYPEKIVLTEKLVEYTNNYLPELDEDTFDSFSSMMCSADSNIVKVCINTLATFNLGHFNTQISLEIKKNYANLMKKKVTSLSSFNRILSLCGLKKDDVHYGHVLDFNEKLYDNATTQENRNLIRNSTLEHIRKDTEERYSSYLSKMGLRVTIN
jgi:succinate dehydrogenase flavin-adding protein (antitoxin of CptAB toxin-antitoxin module)